MYRILVVDDDEKIARIIARYLDQAGYETVLALNGAAAMQAMRQQPFDLLLLDVLLPDTTGLAICQAMRQETSPGLATLPDTPVLMLSALSMTDDIIGGLRSGADDYMVKPFEPRELVERIHTLLRRQQRRQPAAFCTRGNLVLDLNARNVSCSGQALELTRREYDLLAWLAAHPGRVFSREQLLDEVWGTDYDGSDRAVDLCVLRLRNKLAAAGFSGGRIDTVWGAGYRFS